MRLKPFVHFSLQKGKPKARGIFSPQGKPQTRPFCMGTHRGHHLVDSLPSVAWNLAIYLSKKKAHREACKPFRDHWLNFNTRNRMDGGPASYAPDVHRRRTREGTRHFTPYKNRSTGAFPEAVTSAYSVAIWRRVKLELVSFLMKQLPEF